MSAAELIQDCKKRGITLKLVSGDLGYRAPRGTMDSELIAKLEQNKQALIRELKAVGGSFPMDYFDEQIRAAIKDFNNREISMMDFPLSIRHEALRLEERMTDAANRCDRGEFDVLLSQWRKCFH